MSAFPFPNKDGQVPERHSCDEDGSRCDYCGCCQHTTWMGWCKVSDAPQGMSCPGRGCGCEGRS